MQFLRLKYYFYSYTYYYILCDNDETLYVHKCTARILDRFFATFQLVLEYEIYTQRARARTHSLWPLPMIKVNVIRTPVSESKMNDYT